jgi:hypothetical protein
MEAQPLSCFPFAFYFALECRELGKPLAIFADFHAAGRAESLEARSSAAPSSAGAFKAHHQWRQCRFDQSAIIPTPGQLHLWMDTVDSIPREYVRA